MGTAIDHRSERRQRIALVILAVFAAGVVVAFGAPPHTPHSMRDEPTLFSTEALPTP